MAKANRRNAVKLALSQNGTKGVVERLERDFYSDSSRAAKKSREKVVSDILDACMDPLSH
jgi:hypothetical protein